MLAESTAPSYLAELRRCSVFECGDGAQSAKVLDEAIEAYEKRQFNREKTTVSRRYYLETILGVDGCRILRTVEFGRGRDSSCVQSRVGCFQGMWREDTVGVRRRFFVRRGCDSALLPCVEPEYLRIGRVTVGLRKSVSGLREIVLANVCGNCRHHDGELRYRTASLFPGGVSLNERHRGYGAGLSFRIL